jgi:hypothetical protein
MELIHLQRLKGMGAKGYITGRAYPIISKFLLVSGLSTVSPVVRGIDVEGMFGGRFTGIS